jgi:hypothetical protein
MAKRNEAHKAGLLVEIYRPYWGDCSNGGLSHEHRKAILVGDGVPEIFSVTKDAPGVTIHQSQQDPNYHFAVPVEQPTGLCGPMFGGCFIYTSDSLFPCLYPIPLHDRWEAAALNDAMSK